MDELSRLRALAEQMEAQAAAREPRRRQLLAELEKAQQQMRAGPMTRALVEHITRLTKELSQLR